MVNQAYIMPTRMWNEIRNFIDPERDFGVTFIEGYLYGCYGLRVTDQEGYEYIITNEKKFAEFLLTHG